jgi:Flagellar biosynthesis protein, FliO
LGVFANALSLAVGEKSTVPRQNLQERPALYARLLRRLSRRATKQPRLALVERINLAPRQTVALIEADGQRLLVATSTDGAASFYPLKAAWGDSGANLPRSIDSEAESL